MDIRQPVVAGAFYRSSAEACRRDVDRLLHAAEVPADLPGPLVGGIVPHAGWAFSGAIAALTLKALLGDARPRSVVLFGADHRGTVHAGEVYNSGAWRTPLGDVPIDADLAAAVLDEADDCRANHDAHLEEHSLEVQIPIMQGLVKALRIVPIAVPPTDLAVQIGRSVGAVLAGRSDVCVVGSTDLTHHGSRYGFAPGGQHEAGEQWTRANDRRMIELMERMAAERIVPEARQHHNACGAGAIAATVAASRALGATRGFCLEYSNSYAIVHAKQPWDLDDTTVGYAAVVFG
ncbi:MAG TPA: AmmeMemoRadiSam system protein B [Phycisphaerae bacterium]|nr:AmmeMemoRadiSam system protein B [Phycisphaerae bacterium]